MSHCASVAQAQIPPRQGDSRREETGRRKGLALFPALRPTGIEQDHRRCRRQHHADHHHDPHGQGDAGLYGTPRDAVKCRGRCRATGRRRLPSPCRPSPWQGPSACPLPCRTGHAHPSMFMAAASQRVYVQAITVNAGERRCHDDAIPSEQAFKRGVGRHDVSEPRRFRSCADWRSGRANPRAKLPAAARLGPAAPHSQRSYSKPCGRLMRAWCSSPVTGLTMGSPRASIHPGMLTRAERLST